MRGVSSTRRTEIDGLRAVAALWVMCDHFGLSALVGMHYGFLAVRVMLVLSAYFAARQLRSLWSPSYALQNGVPTGESVASTLMHYYTSRVIRLGLVAYAAIFLAVLFNADGARATWQWHATFATNLWILKNTDWPGCLSHFWSLAVQMQFLLLLPLAVLILGRRLPLFLFGGILAALVHRTCVWVNDAEAFIRWMPLTNSLDAFCMGFGLAWAQQERPEWFKKLELPSLTAVALFFLVATQWIRGVSYDSRWGVLIETGEAIAMTLLFGALLVGRSYGPVGRVLRSTPLVKLGAASLSLYALHPIVERLLAYLLVGRDAPQNPAHIGLWFQGMAAATSILMAWIGFFLLEIPARKITTLIETGSKAVTPALLAFSRRSMGWLRPLQPVGAACLCLSLIYGSMAPLRYPAHRTFATETEEAPLDVDSLVPFFLDNPYKAENIT